MGGRLYQHETIDVAAGRVRDYLEAVGEVFAPIGVERRMPFCGVFQVAATSGRWPQVVCLMEIGDWATYAWQRTTSSTHPGMERWKRDALRWRGSGFDHMLELLPFSPVPPVAPRFAGSGRVFVQQSLTARPGAVEPLLAHLERSLLPGAAGDGMRLEGAWRSVFQPGELIVIGSLEDWNAYARMQLARDARVGEGGEPLPGLGPAWEWLADLQERILMPTAFSPLGGGTGELVTTI